MIQGRYDLTIDTGTETYPSWVEFNGPESRFVGRVGSARPVTTVKIDPEGVYWSLPPQYENRTSNLEFAARLEDGILVGTSQGDGGELLTFRGVPAPSLPSREMQWGEPMEMIGPDLGNWMLRNVDWENHWRISEGMLHNDGVGSDLVSRDVFMDFRLVAEYKYPAKSNSGIYLRGRYEFQIVDDYGQAPGLGTSGAIYGFLIPSKSAVRPAGEWNTVEITLVGRWVTIIQNGELILDNQEIPGITGGALDSHEGDPGPIFLQGDHGPVVFRRLTLTPAR
jgi:hypothetical protein